MNSSPLEIIGALQKYALEGTMEVALIKREVITHDSYIFTYELPEKDLILGLKPGNHIAIK